MAKTFIQLINLVGRNVRRSGGAVAAYTTLDADSGEIIIQEAINEAKRQVEDAWKWRSLRTTITFPSIASTASYDTSSLSVVSSDPSVTNDRSYLVYDALRRPQFFDVTTSLAGFRLKVLTHDEAVAWRRYGTNDVSIPGEVAVYNNGSGLVCVFPQAPSGVRNYSFEAVVPQEDLDATTDTLTVPYRPVVLAATALALEERGEEFGNAAQRYWDRFESALASAIASDMEDADATAYPQ